MTIQVSRTLIRTREMQVLEAAHGKPINELLTELYVAQALTVDEVGAALGVTKGTISRWLERCGIPARRQGRAA
jgi:excisionase family DNA binding protein